MRIIITGGNGFIGSHLREYIKGENIEVVNLSRTKCQESVSTDYTLDSLKDILIPTDIVIHLAATRTPNVSISAYFDDLTVTQNILDACSEKGIKNIVYASTISVYSDLDKLPWHEEQTIQPHSHYGIAKATGEMLCELYNDKHSLNIKVLRLAHVFGPLEKNNYMINLFMRKAFNKQQLELNTLSTEKREFIYVKDVVKAIWSAIKKPEYQGIYNVGSDIKLTNYEVAEKINHIFENDKPIVVLRPDCSDNTVPSFMQSLKVREELGFTSSYSFEQSLLEIKKELEELEDVPIRY